MTRRFASDPFAGRSVLLTGGTSGIGAAAVTRFLAGATPPEVEAVQAQQVLACAQLQRLDVSDADAIKGLIEGLDRLDILVNCAGIIRRTAACEPETFADGPGSC